MIRILFFAQLRESFGQAYLDIDITDGISLSVLREKLIRDYPALQSLLNQKNLLMSVNLEYATDSTQVKSGDEIAFFPPVTGG